MEQQGKIVDKTIQYRDYYCCKGQEDDKDGKKNAKMRKKKIQRLICYSKQNSF